MRSATVLLNCFTLDISERMLYGRPLQNDLTDTALAVWARYRESLRILADETAVDKELACCIPDAIIRLQPAGCLQLFILSMQPNSRYPLSTAWNPSPALLWYSMCTKLFDGGQGGEDLASLLEAALKTLEAFLLSMSQLQLMRIDQSTINSLGSEAKLLLQSRLQLAR